MFSILYVSIYTTNNIRNHTHKLACHSHEYLYVYRVQIERRMNNYMPDFVTLLDQRLKPYTNIKGEKQNKGLYISFVLIINHKYNYNSAHIANLENKANP